MHAARFVAVALAAVVLSGCSVEPAPSASASASVEPVPSASAWPATPTPPTGPQPQPTFTCEPVPAEALDRASRSADAEGWASDGRAAMVRGGVTSQGFPWRIIALGGKPRAEHPDAVGTVLWWGPAEGAPLVEPDGRVRGQFAPISVQWGGSNGLAFSVEWGREGQAAATACPLA